MTKKQLNDFYRRKEELELMESECNGRLNEILAKRRKNMLTCDGRMPDGSIARGHIANRYLCKICHASHDFDSMKLK